MERVTYTDIATKFVLPDIVFFNDMMRMTQEQMGMLYKKAQSTISEHIKKIYCD
ncbi:MAG: hypothetical protein LBI53_01400 [Candidatus Peribacteria bacterium]|jgi:hypothetical protein|nr:hypothetical protein [Candidatus Peribacteria bacterium]